MDKDFKEYVLTALKQYNESKAKIKGVNFQEFLLLVLIYKTEEVLERLEDMQRS